MRAFRSVLVFTMFFPAGQASAVVPIAADPVIQPGHYFDLEGKTLNFKPLPRGYSVSSSRVRPPGAPGELLGKADYQFIRSWGYRKPLPFPFRFGGKVWREVFINGAGNLTFGQPEAELYPRRDTWPDGTMQSVGGSINDRSAAGQELMICALWAQNAPEDDKTQMYFRQSATEFVVTWKTQRYQWFGEGYRPLGPNIFQARLTPDGAIALSYQQVSEKDGIVGVFPGGFSGRQIATLNGGFVEASQAGGTLRFSFAREKGSPQAAATRQYRVVLASGPNICEIGITLGDFPKPWFGGLCTGNPGYRIGDHRIELFATTFELQNALQPGVRWAAWPGSPTDDPDRDGHPETVPFPLTAPVAPERLSAMKGDREGNIFEVFHYPHLSKHPYPLLNYIYRQAPPRDDLVAIFTDFRIDDLHNHQGTRTPYGNAVKGIGEGLDEPADTFPVTGSHQLQAVTGPAYLGPRYEEFTEDGDRHFRNYANAVGWLAHEFGHRWGLALQFRNPNTGKTESLSGSNGHWSDYLSTPATISVWKMFGDKPYVEKSQMEGFVYYEGPTGVFFRQIPEWNIASGFSALDLYVMGLIGPEEVPDTFLIARPQLRTGQELWGEKVPVRIRDIIAASGERFPGVRESQKNFTVALYLLHQSGREPYADKLRQAEGIEKSLVGYYRAATGGRMRLIAVEPPAVH
jgi:hypothetical protein